MPELWRWKELGIFDATVEIQVDHKALSGSHSGYESRMPGSRIWSRPRSQTSMSPRRGNLLFIDKILIWCLDTVGKIRGHFLYYLLNFLDDFLFC